MIDPKRYTVTTKTVNVPKGVAIEFDLHQLSTLRTFLDGILPYDGAVLEDIKNIVTEASVEVSQKLEEATG